MKPVVVITMGDPAGIGPEIAAKAAASPRIRKICTLIFVGNFQFLKPFIKKNISYTTVELPFTSEHVSYGKPNKEAGLCALSAIRKGVELCLNGKADALVTAPVSKHACRLSDPSFTGHTEMLAKLCRVKQPIMMMQARHMRFIMLTRHVPLRDVNSSISRKYINETIKLSILELKKKYHIRIRKAVICALNPHAGEEGHIGNEEKEIIIPAVKDLRRSSYPVEGPLPSDTAIKRLAEKKYDLCFGMYHDQVMIPLKLMYPREIVNITLGLPFIRTSPGHGVAYDIAGKNKADPKSMEEAIRVAVEMLAKRRDK